MKNAVHGVFRYVRAAFVRITLIVKAYYFYHYD